MPDLDPPEAGSWTLPGPTSRTVTIAVAAVVLILGLTVSAFLWDQSDSAAATAERDTTRRLGDRLAAEVEALAAGLSGTNLLARDSGNVDEPSFRRFAASLTATTAMTAVAYEPLVRRSEIDRFERSTGITVVDRSEGDVSAADDRPIHMPVLWVHPSNPTTAQLVGFDLMGEEVRGAAVTEALRSEALQVTEPLPSVPAGETSLFFVQAVFVNETPIGAVSSAISGDTLAERIASSVPSDTDVSVWDGDQRLFGPETRSGTAVPVDVGNRRWYLWADRPPADHTASLVAMIITLATAALATTFLVRGRRQAIELNATATSIRLIGRLSERLAFCTSQEQLVERAAAWAMRPVGAAESRVLLDGAPVTKSSRGATPLDQALSQAMRTGRLAIIDHSPIELDSETAVALPLWGERERRVGAIGWSWKPRQRVSSRLHTTLQALATLWQNGLLRVSDLETQGRLTSSLYEMGQALSIARSEAEIAGALVDHGPQASGFDAVALGLLREPEQRIRIHRRRHPLAGPIVTEEAVLGPAPRMDVLRNGQTLAFNSRSEIDAAPALRGLVGPSVESLTLVPVRNSSAKLLGAVAFGSLGPPPYAQANLRSIADLVGQTLERSELFEQQAQVVLQLQERALVALPRVPGVGLEARYLPAAREMGVGGDWYGAEQLSDDEMALVVGDVVGHGITAVVDMVEISGMISAVVRSERSLETLPARAAALLADARRPLTRMATAIVMMLDLTARTGRYVRLGHLPALLLRPDGEVEVLEGAAHPPLGVMPHETHTELLTWEPGSTILLFTDGLVERRGESIDVGLQRASEALIDTAGLDARAATDSIMRHCAEGGHNVDDIAVLLVQLT